LRIENVQRGQQISATGHAGDFPSSRDATRDGELEQAVSEVLRLFDKLDIIIPNEGSRSCRSAGALSFTQ
jgi:hypothetical protein